MHRYAVLHDLTTEQTLPVGFAVELDDHVLVHLPRTFGIPEKHDGEYHVRQPDMNFITYRPGDAGYFDQVLVDLSWGFGVGEQDTLADVTDKTLLELQVSRIDRVLAQSRHGEYDLAMGFLPERQAGSARVGFGQDPVYCPEPEEVEYLAVAAKGIVSV
jgi:hypothetical protein